MYRTPSRTMVNTRSTQRKNAELYGETSGSVDAVARDTFRTPNTETGCGEQTKPSEDAKRFDSTSEIVQNRRDKNLPTKSEKKLTSRTKSSSSSVLARRRRLELEAAEAKARIEKDLIDKRLAADLAELEDEEIYSPQSEGEEVQTKHEVERWLERSHDELEAQAIPQTDTQLDGLVAPPPLRAQHAAVHGGTDGTVQMLASALKDLAAASTSNASNKNAKQFESTLPDAVDAICKQHYMDDYIDSIEDESTAVRLTKEIARIHKHGGFEIRNWISNSEAVLINLPHETLRPTAVKFKIGQHDAGERTLGLIWFPKEDELGFDVSFKRIPADIINGLKRPTKREMLRLLMSIFDVYGFLLPFTIKAKILLQQMWKINLSWDEEIPENINVKWINWLKLLKEINNIRLPRCYHASARESETGISEVTDAPNSEAQRPPAASRLLTEPRDMSARAVTPQLCKQRSYTNLELHTFADASTQAMCAVAYWRWVREVLPDLRPRTKWQQEQKPLQVGDLVIIVDPDAPRNVWPRGRIEKVMPGKDGRVRVLDIKTKTGLMRRSAARVARVPTGDEC